MDRIIAEHYKLYYNYIPARQKDGEEPGNIVNSLFGQVMRNDQEALEEVIRILLSNTYSMVVKRLGTKGIYGIEHIDELMQKISCEVMKLAFRGFPEWVSQEGFFGCLLGIAENCCKDFNKKCFQDLKRRNYEKDGTDIFQVLDTVKTVNWEVENVEQKILDEEASSIIREILKFYLKALQETALPPYQVITYCYAILLPQLFKRSRNPEFLSQLAKISGGDGKKPSSGYNEKEGKLEGKIARDSVILLNFAFSVMDQETVGALSQEFLELYRMEPLQEGEFAWGQAYQGHLEEVKEGKQVKELVVTEDFARNAVKNWPIRVAKSLLNDTEQWAAKDKGFRKKSVGIAEDLFIGGRE